MKTLLRAMAEFLKPDHLDIEQEVTVAGDNVAHALGRLQDSIRQKNGFIIHCDDNSFQFSRFGHAFILQLLTPVSFGVISITECDRNLIIHYGVASWYIRYCCVLVTVCIVGAIPTVREIAAIWNGVGILAQMWVVVYAVMFRMVWASVFKHFILSSVISTDKRKTCSAGNGIAEQIG